MAHEDPTSQPVVRILAPGRCHADTCPVGALDVRLGGGSLRGMASNTQDGTAAVPYTLDYFDMGLAVRAGKRIAFDNVALAAGGGVSGSMFLGLPHVDDTAPIEDMLVEPPGMISDLALPVWAAITIKPSCDWGVQGMAEYDLRPFTDAPASPAFALGLIYQPASACL